MKGVLGYQVVRRFEDGVIKEPAMDKAGKEMDELTKATGRGTTMTRQSAGGMRTPAEGGS